MTATSSSITSSLPKDKKRSKKRSSAATSGRRDVTPTPDKENIPHDVLENGGKSAPLPTENMDQIRPEGSDFDRSQSAVANAGTDAFADKERQMTYDTRLTYAIWDLATTGANPAVDLLICLERRHTIGFRYVDITRPIVIHHGSKDNRVPVENVKWLGKTMRKCEVRVLEGEGHGLMASAMVMGNVLMEISKEWEDWNRATGTQRERGRSFRAGVR
jgi:pimeloyl-ACP methyl ester carboxylesterase